MKYIGVIGLGRVGLPLTLFLESIGFSVLGIDNNNSLIEILKKKKMPFDEKGCSKLLNKSKIKFTNEYSSLNHCSHIIITVGTPLMSNIETDLTAIKNVIKNITPYLKKNVNLILRSTVAPKTTILVKKIIEKQIKLKIGKDIGLSFCPERLAENHALEELGKLPQIIGSDDKFSMKLSNKLFKKFGVKILNTSTISAELVKLFNNIDRYIKFAVANQFAIYSDLFDQNVYDIINMANLDYPRGYIHTPGFASGTCLRKDFGFINELSSTPDLTLSAWKINEYMPFHLVNGLKKITHLSQAKIGILGYTFKRDSDDTRDSLVPKLIRYLSREVPKKISIHEPNIKNNFFEINGDKYSNITLNNIIKDSSIIVIAINHKEFDYSKIFKKIKKNTLVCDLWNTQQLNKLIFKK